MYKILSAHSRPAQYPQNYHARQDHTVLSPSQILGSFVDLAALSVNGLMVKESICS